MEVVLIMVNGNCIFSIRGSTHKEFVFSAQYILTRDFDKR
jgi:hypothetical protein